MSRIVALVLALSFAARCRVSPETWKGKKQSKGNSQDTQVTVVFNDTQRGAARAYFVNAYGKR